MRPLRLSVILLALYLTLAAVASAQPSTRFAELENNLLNTSELRPDFYVTATGAIQADI